MERAERAERVERVERVGSSMLRHNIERKREALPKS